MKSLIRPSTAAVTDWLSECRSERPTFDITSDGTTRGYFKDDFRIQLGTGADCYRHACSALKEWKMFPSTMATLIPSLPTVEQDTDLAVAYLAGPLWTVNPCRIVDVTTTKSTNGESFRITYATLPGHVEQGWEQFAVERRHEDDTIWYIIQVYSRPKWWPVWLVLPYARYQQRRFQHLSGKAIMTAIRDSRCQPAKP